MISTIFSSQWNTVLRVIFVLCDFRPSTLVIHRWQQGAKIKQGANFPLYTVAQRRITLYFISLIFFYQKCSNIINWFFFFTKNVPTFVTHLKLPIPLCDTESAAITLAHIWNIHWQFILRSVYKDSKKRAQNKS